MSKKGQLTLFVIIAVVIVIAVIIYFYLQGNLLGQQKYDPKVELVRENVLDCLQENYQQSLELIGIQGGYLTVPEPRNEIIAYYFSWFIPYYYHEGELNIPTLETIEKEISLYTKEKLPFCTKNFLNFNDLTIKQGEIEVTTKIKDDEIIINTIYPIQIEKDGSTAYLRDFNDIQIPIRLGTIKKAVDEIAINQRNKEGICLDCLINVTEKYDLYIDMTDFEEGIVIFIKDKQSIIDEEKFLFIFATEVDPIE